MCHIFMTHREWTISKQALMFAGDILVHTKSTTPIQSGSAPGTSLVPVGQKVYFNESWTLRPGPALDTCPKVSLASRVDGFSK